MWPDDTKRRREGAQRHKQQLETKIAGEYENMRDCQRRLRTASRWSRGEIESKIRRYRETIDSLQRKIDYEDSIIASADEELAAREAAATTYQAQYLSSIRTPRVKEALLWWNNEAQDLPAYARIYWERILKDEEDIVDAYKSDRDQCATMEQCREIAAWALREIPREVAHHLPDESDRTVDKLAEILRRHHGDRAERLIPLARQILLASMSPAEEPAPPPPAGPPADSVLADLPPELQTELADLEPGLRNAMSVEEADNLVAQLLARRDRELSDAGVPEQDRQVRLMRYERNLQDAVRKWRRARGLL